MCSIVSKLWMVHKGHTWLMTAQISDSGIKVKIKKCDITGFSRGMETNSDNDVDLTKSKNGWNQKMICKEIGNYADVRFTETEF